mmetsp:Transcript_23865/g.63882  ORF Transcript_23865/g.63882 Transcript_23865/m.63882 type:complete len:332 (+) Transcript_23865:165-1160(+)
MTQADLQGEERSGAQHGGYLGITPPPAGVEGATLGQRCRSVRSQPPLRRERRVCAPIQEQARDLGVALHRGGHQRRSPRGAARVDVCLVPQRELDLALVAAARRVQQPRPPVPSQLHDPVHHAQLARPGRDRQGPGLQEPGRGLVLTAPAQGREQRQVGGEELEVGLEGGQPRQLDGRAVELLEHLAQASPALAVRAGGPVGLGRGVQQPELQPLRLLLRELPQKPHAVAEVEEAVLDIGEVRRHGVKLHLVVADRQSRALAGIFQPQHALEQHDGEKADDRPRMHELHVFNGHAAPAVQILGDLLELLVQPLLVTHRGARKRTLQRRLTT